MSWGVASGVELERHYSYEIWSRDRAGIPGPYVVSFSFSNALLSGKVKAL